MSADKNPAKIKKIFNEISANYDIINSIMSLGTHYIIKFLAVKTLNPKPRSEILDICCGTGDLVNIITKFYPRTKIIGLDFAQSMLKKAKLKNPKGVFVQADATDLPFGKDEFDCVTVGFGLRNIQNRTIALQEIHRVLKKGGKFLQLDFGYHNIFSGIFDIFVFLITKFKSGTAQNYSYLTESKKDFPEPDMLIKEIEQQGFQCEKSNNYMFGVINAQVYIKI